MAEAPPDVLYKRYMRYRDEPHLHNSRMARIARELMKGDELTYNDVGEDRSKSGKALIAVVVSEMCRAGFKVRKSSKPETGRLVYYQVIFTPTAPPQVPVRIQPGKRVTARKPAVKKPESVIKATPVPHLIPIIPHPQLGAMLSLRLVTINDANEETWVLRDSDNSYHVEVVSWQKRQ